MSIRVQFSAGHLKTNPYLKTCCVGVTLTNTKANPGFVLYDQLNKARSHSHQSQINKSQVAYHFCFYLSLQKTRHFQRTNLNSYLPKMLQSKKATTKISSQTEFTMSRRLSAHNKFRRSHYKLFTS